MRLFILVRNVNYLKGGTEILLGIAEEKELAIEEEF